MNLILGINAGHDSAVCLISNGEIVYAIEEEKISRIKQDIGWPELAVERILKESNLSPKDINCISLEDAVPEHLGKYEIVYRFTKNKLFKYFEYFSRIRQFIFKGNRISTEKNKKTIKQILREKGYSNARIEYHDHHLSHAASAFYTAPFISDLTITCDGRGGINSFNFYGASNGGLELIHSNSYKHSIGVFYSNVTEILGFRANRHEGKITGLAAYGKVTKLCDEFKSLFLFRDGNFQRYPFGDPMPSWANSNSNKKSGIINRINLFTSSNKISEDFAIRNLLLKEKMLEICAGYSKEDIAYACQYTAEYVVIKEFENVCRKKNLSKLKVSLAGGVFANVKLNQLIVENELVENIFVHPAMGDQGLALGNAVLADLSGAEERRKYNSYAIKNAFLGADYSEDLKQVMKSFNHDLIGYRELENCASEIATLLSENKIIGFWNGRMEWGPRALGSRSIILNTFNEEVNQTLNNRLDRTEFMPFAPVVLDYMAKEYFPKYDENIPAAEYMTITYDTDTKYTEKLQATVHVDGTARPQVIRRLDAELYYDVLDEFYKITKCGALVNTSFNAHEEPILSSPETAFKALIDNRVDYLVMEKYLFWLK